MTADAETLFTKANTAMKLQDPVAAVRLYQQIVAQMLPGDEIREKAQKVLETIKP
jgi:hypothetical protein